VATMTAAARRARAKVEYNAMNADCPTRQLVDVLSDKWVCLVFCALLRGSARHSEIARQISGVSQKMLTQTLRNLERDGFVTRTVTAEVPVRVDYELTALGRHFAPVIISIKTWAEAHMDDVLAARKRHQG
jgi:DNA-binding HxlR family transcriptional regulator